jgi:pimeloyl-ACP methyl ester carboxylesterase
MPTLRTENAELFYEKRGAGRPVVFINGWGTASECWAAAVARLAQRFTCLTYDPRGVGRSWASEGASFEPDAHVEDLAELCEAERIFDAHLIGHDLGGRVAMLAARMHPQLASTITVVSWWGASEIRQTLGEFARFRQAASLLLRDLGTFPVLRNLVAWSYRRVPEPHRTALFERFAELDARAAYLTLMGAADPAAAAAFDDAVGRLAIPALLVQGGEDREAARAGLRRLFDRLPNVDLATIHGAGSLPMLEYPDAFCRTLEQFFAEHDPIPGSRARPVRETKGEETA